MFFATTSPAEFSRQRHASAGRSLERFLVEAQQRPKPQQQASCLAEQDETSSTLTFDVPGVPKDQLTIGIEGSTVRVNSREGAPRHYQFALELPQEINRIPIIKNNPIFFIFLFLVDQASSYFV